MTDKLRACLLFFTLVCTSGAALAQISLSASLASDFQYRGMSLSEERPSAAVSINMDTDIGLYGGASLARARLRYTEVDAQLLAYVGYARRIGTQYGWDAGVTETRYSGAKRYNYRELHVGLGSERYSARVFVAPHYFGVGKRSVYTEMNGSHPLTEHIDFNVHLGHLVRPQARTDIKLGLSAAMDDWTVQLAWVGTKSNAGLYPFLYTAHPRRVVLSTARVF